MADPSRKSAGMQAFLDEFAKKHYGRTRTESIQSDICVSCGKEATEFNDSLSRKEYTISGLCQVCQDETFKPEEDEETEHYDDDYNVNQPENEAEGESDELPED